MTDTRFATVFDDLDGLLAGVDVDEVGDIETLLMFLFGRPVGIQAVWNDDAQAMSLEVVVMSGYDGAFGSVYNFPISVMDLVRSCAEALEELGPYTRDGASRSVQAQDVLTMSDTELVTTLQDALGKVRLFNIMEGDE